MRKDPDQLNFFISFPPTILTKTRMSVSPAFTIPLDGSAWKLGYTSAPNKQRNTSVPRPASSLFSTIYDDSLVQREIQHILQRYTVDEIKTWTRREPLLHEACANVEKGGAQCILRAFFENPLLNGLFIDDTYINSQGLRADQQLSERHNLSKYNSFVIDEIVRAFNIVSPTTQAPSDSARLFETLHSNLLFASDIRRILDSHSVEEIKKWHRCGHPLLHEACEQSEFSGAQAVLRAFFEDSRLKKLFTDISYTDKRGMIVANRLGNVVFFQVSTPSLVTRIMEEFKIVPIKPRTPYW